MVDAEEANRRYFREAYRTGEHGWAVEGASPFAVACLERIRRECGAGRMLDIGCGEGRHAIAAARLGFRVTAMDFEPLALRRARAFARKAGVGGITFREGNVQNLPFAPGAFDVALDYGCLHHQRKREWPRYLGNVLRVLKPRAWFVLTVFSPRFRLFAGSRRRWHIGLGSYRRCFTRADIRGLFAPDFEIIELEEERGEGGGFWHVLMRQRDQHEQSR